MNKELYEISYSINGLSNSVLLSTDKCPTALSLSERNAFIRQAVKCIINGKFSIEVQKSEGF